MPTAQQRMMRERFMDELIFCISLPYVLGMVGSVSVYIITYAFHQCIQTLNIDNVVYSSMLGHIPQEIEHKPYYCWQHTDQHILFPPRPSHFIKTIPISKYVSYDCCTKDHLPLFRASETFTANTDLILLVAFLSSITSIQAAHINSSQKKALTVVTVFCACVFYNQTHQLSNLMDPGRMIENSENENSQLFTPRL